MSTNEDRVVCEYGDRIIFRTADGKYALLDAADLNIRGPYPSKTRAEVVLMCLDTIERSSVVEELMRKNGAHYDAQQVTDTRRRLEEKVESL